MSQAPIGRWVFDREAARLVSGTEERKLEDRAARTLTLLCDRRGAILSQEEILQIVWQGRTVSPNSLAVVIRDLRRGPGGDARQPRFIETIAKRGYRLAAADPVPRRRLWPIAALLLVG